MGAEADQKPNRTYSPYGIRYPESKLNYDKIHSALSKNLRATGSNPKEGTVILPEVKIRKSH